ncbi:MAG: S-layer homology domain-containing protein [Oscillibacter sp.]|nr:S-layer homology domain-containing protein [Oscillibacter sp.]
MKKFLSLVLALVMAMSLVTISAGAKDFEDNSDINYADAVAVMSELKVVDGYTDGTFRPEAQLNRGAAAKIVCNMILGPTTASALSASSAPFSDVPADHVFAGYIAYCSKEGIINGYSDGTFRPTAPLTGYAFMKMLLGALGYDPDLEGYTGANWSINVAKQAINLGLDDGNDDFVGTKYVTREEACLYAFNTLQAEMVEYDSKTTVTVNGAEVVVGGSEAKVVEDGYTFADAYFTKLSVIEDAEDDFGRPAKTWKNGKTTIGTFAEAADLTYTGAEYDEDLVEELEEDYDFADADVWYNGAKGVVDADELNVNGYTIELFINDDDEVTDIVVTEAYVVEVTDVIEDDDDEITAVELTVYEAGYYIANEAYATIEISVEDDEDAYELIASYEEDDVFAAYLLPGWEEKDADDALLAVVDVETVEGKITAKSADEYYEGWIKIDGVKYEFANEYSQVAVATKDEGTFYLLNGYVVHADVEEAESTDYLVVIEAAKETGIWGDETNYAKVVYADGTTEEIETEELATAGSAYSYKYNDDKAYYELTVKDAASELTITKGTSLIKSGIYGNSKTVYVLVALDEDGEVDDVDVYTSYKKVPTTTGDAAVVDKDGLAKVVFVIDGELDTSADDMIYVAGAGMSDLTTDEAVDSDGFYTTNAVVDGEIVEIMVDVASYDGLYKSSSTSEGIYTLSNAATAEGEEPDYYVAASMKAASDEVVNLGGTKMAYADDVVVYVVSAKGAITEGSISKNYTNSIAQVLYTMNDDAEVDMIIVERA